MPQNVTCSIDLYLDDIALTSTPPQVVIASTPSNSDFQSQHVIDEVSNGSNIHNIFMFVKNKSISNMLENGAIDNPMLMFVFEFVKKINKLERHYFISYIFIIFYT